MPWPVAAVVPRRPARLASNFFSRTCRTTPTMLYVPNPTAGPVWLPGWVGMLGWDTGTERGGRVRILLIFVARSDHQAGAHAHGDRSRKGMISTIDISTYVRDDENTRVRTVLYWNTEYGWPADLLR
jgi:hypothetical protein